MITKRDLLTISIILMLAGIAMSLIGCKAEATDPNQVTGNPVVFESVLEVHWTNGTQTHHEMFGPLPGDGVAFVPGPDWYVALRGATAHTKAFSFHYPTIPADRVIWKLVWIPQNAQASLVWTPIPERTLRRVAIMSPGDMSHPVSYPRNQEVDVTEAFNEAIRFGQLTVFHWDVRISQ